MPEFYDKSIICPYYVSDSKVGNQFCLKCEQFPFTDGLKQYFSTSEKRSKYKNAFCRQFEGYLKCPVSREHEKYYEDDDDTTDITK